MSSPPLPPSPSPPPRLMRLKKTIHKTKNFLCKTFQNLKSFLGMKNAHPQLPLSNPFFSNRISDSTIKELDEFYRTWSQQWESNNNKTVTQESAKEQSPRNPERVIGIQKNLEKASDDQRRLTREPFSRSAGSKRINICISSRRSLAQKMKELEMMDMEDVDQILDIEEVLHYYSRLKCPLYLDIVDTFFTDMYTEFSLPQPTLSVTYSSRRSLGPTKL